MQVFNNTIAVLIWLLPCTAGFNCFLPGTDGIALHCCRRIMYRPALQLQLLKEQLLSQQYGIRNAYKVFDEYQSYSNRWFSLRCYLIIAVLLFWFFFNLISRIKLGKNDIGPHDRNVGTNIVDCWLNPFVLYGHLLIQHMVL